MKMSKATFNILKFSYKNINRALAIFFIAYFCSGCLPGINKNVKKQKSSQALTENYIIKDINVDIIEIEDLNEDQINIFNSSKIEELKYSINKFPKIYNYEYAYALDTSDIISIDLTDTDDIDGTYTVDPIGDIDLPFVGKVKINNLSLDQAQEVLLDKIKEYYKNPDLQITIDEYNSSKAYIVGAVKNQTTINLLDNDSNWSTNSTSFSFFDFFIPSVISLIFFMSSGFIVVISISDMSEDICWGTNF